MMAVFPAPGVPVMMNLLMWFSFSRSVRSSCGERFGGAVTGILSIASPSLVIQRISDSGHWHREPGSHPKHCCERKARYDRRMQRLESFSLAAGVLAAGFALALC